MSARIGRLKHEILHSLFADLHGEDLALSIGQDTPPAAFVQCIFGIDQIPAVLRQPVGPVKGGCGFFAAGQRHLDRALGLESFLLETDQAVRPDRGLRLVIRRAARVEKTVLFDQRERIARPVGPVCLDHVDMREQQDRLRLFGGAGIDRDQAAFLGLFRC